MSDFEEDLSNVMGSFISMELDYIEKSSNELEEVTKERDLYKEVIEEVKEYINNLGTQDGMLKDYKIDRFIKEDILQILDKVKGE